MFSFLGSRTGAVWGRERHVSKGKPLIVVVLDTLCVLACHHAPQQAPDARSEAALPHRFYSMPETKG